MNRPFTRRKLGLLFSSGAGLLTAHAQEAPANPPADLQTTAKQQLRKDSEAIAGVELSPSTEPAFQFKA